MRVDPDDLKQLAQAVVMSLAGVRSVENQLVVK